MSVVHYQRCPVCDDPAIDPLLTIRDHSISQEDFVVWQCAHCALRFTQDVPDAATIGKYYASANYISHTNTSKGLVNGLYKKVRKYTLRKKARDILGFTKNKGRILDVGAGVGAFLSTMRDEGWEVVGLEPDAETRVRAKQDFNIDLQDSAELSRLESGSFDAITLWHVLEHVHDLHVYIEQLKRLLKKEGRIFIAVPNYRAADSKYYGSYWAAYDVPRHLYHFSPKSIDILMHRHDLRLLDKQPMWFDSFYISLLSSKYRNGGKTNWLGAGLAGLRSNFSAFINRDRASSITYIIGK